MERKAIQRELDETLVASYASHQWQSKRARSHWVDLEGWQDCLAGPLTSIAKHGGCAYVYERNDGWFDDVHEPDSLGEYFLIKHRGLSKGVEQFAPSSAGESTDWEYMRSLVARLLPVIEAALAIEKTRWLSLRT